MTDHLAIIIDGRIMGEIRKDKRARLTLTYDADWRQTPDAYPLSLSMPLVVAEHENAKIEPWLWGLLPDNEAILRQWEGLKAFFEMDRTRGIPARGWDVRQRSGGSRLAATWSMWRATCRSMERCAVPSAVSTGFPS